MRKKLRVTFSFICKWRGRALVALCCIALSLLPAACGEGERASKDFDTEEGTNVNLKRGVKPEADAEVAVLETDLGSIVIELYPNIAPKMVERFKTLVREGFYNGTTFHRINPELGVIQGGDPNSRDDNPANDGMGDSPYPDVEGEFSDVPFERGVVGAARQGPHPAFGDLPALTDEQARNTANCQFYITLKRVAQWDGQYTVFGRVIEGMNNADIISTAPLKQGTTETPETRIIIRRATLQPRASFSK